MSPDSLQQLMKAARTEPRESRIDYRDRIAAFGSHAIAAITPWIDEREFAAFAVRVIAIAGTVDRAKAIEALTAARPNASGTIKSDIDNALNSLGWKPPAPKPVAPPVEVAENLYEQLVAAARAGRTITYTDAGATIGLTMRNPNHRRLLGQHLGAISTRETEHGRPMLSAVVVQKGERRTGTGFAQLGEELGIKRGVQDDRTFDVSELDRVFAYWGPAGPGSDTKTSASDDTNPTSEEAMPS